MAFNMRDYWPVLAPKEQLLVHTETSHYGPPVRSVLHRYVNRGEVNGLPVMRKDSFLSAWVTAWELREGDQMLEVADWFPGRHKVYEVGKEIPWGGEQEIGQVINLPVHVDVAASVGETTGIHNWGRQILTFEELIPSLTLPSGLTFENVLKVHLLHSWCKSGTDCAYPQNQWVYKLRYWFAPGLGFVQTQFIETAGTVFNPPRTDYAVQIMRTWETP